MFRKTGLFAVVGLFAAFLVSSGFAQESSTHTPSRSAAAMQNVEPAQFLHAGKQPVQIPTGAATQPLPLKRHALISVPSPHLREDLKSSGPAASGKNYSSLGLSKANFLSSTAAKSISLPPSFGLTGVDARKLRSSKHPNSSRN